MGCGGSRENLSAQTKEFLMMIDSKPTLHKYGHSAENLKMLGKAIASPVFGGSVLLPVAKKGNSRLKKNPLEQEINTLNTEIMYGGGYYQLTNIRESDQTQDFLDVFVLTPSIKNNQVADRVKTADAMSRKSAEIEQKTRRKSIKEKDVRNSFTQMSQQKTVFWNEIKEAITGYVRIIRYTNHSVPNIIDVDQMANSGEKVINMSAQNLEIKTVEEGCFKDGLKDGYCRVIDAKTGNCEVGFFQKNAPMGKYCMYKIDGTYVQPEGLYEGHGQCKTKIEIANYMQKISRGDSDTKRQIYNPQEKNNGNTEAQKLNPMSKF